MEDSPLFRLQALAHRLSREHGSPRLHTPPGAWSLCLLLLAIIILAVWFLIHNDYARKATVIGYVSSNTAAKRLYAAKPVLVEQLLVASGDLVTAGQVLAVLRPVDAMDTSDVHAMKAEYASQLDDNLQQSKALRRESIIASTRVKAALKRLSEGIARETRIIALQASKVAQLKETCDAALPLYRQGQLSRLEWSRIRANWLDARQHLEQLKDRRAGKQDALVSNRSEAKTRRARFDARIAALALDASRIRQAVRTLAAGHELKLRASVNGRIANVFAGTGDSVTPGHPLVSILPDDNRLVARLLVPSHAAGFLRPGQSVHLLYDAFPYQRFGSYPASLIRISRQAILPGETRLPVSIRQPYFEAVAAITKPSVIAYGKRLPIRAGMTLKADIVLEHRSLGEWLLAPVLALSKRGF